MIRVVINGAQGRMGSTVTALVEEADDLSVAGRVDVPGSGVSSDISPLLASADVVVDFTNPDSALACLEACATGSVPFITGTTGIGEKQIERARELSSRIPVIFSPNMSSGVNLLFGLVGEVSAALPDFDIEISEIHHRRKKDSPSGTAAKIADIVRGERNGSSLVHGREGMVGERTDDEIGMHSLRGGDVVGEHTVIFAGEGERLELTHKAHSRLTFAMGTLRAIRFIYGKAPGFYSMSDVLGLRPRD
jgi:4-hydroxy-tetrahydrodipicolinate reductase